jgi:hypothetical protein
MLSFLDLPAEVRLIIYVHLFGPAYSNVYMLGRPRRPREMCAADRFTSILSTCQVCYHEALPQMYKSFAFCMDDVVDEKDFDPATGSGWMLAVPASLFFLPPLEKNPHEPKFAMITCLRTDAFQLMWWMLFENEEADECEVMLKIKLLATYLDQVLFYFPNLEHLQIGLCYNMQPIHDFYEALGSFQVYLDDLG